MLSTVEQIELARQRLSKRDPNSLVAFILSLAQDSGPVGEQVRTFIVGDDVAKAVEAMPLSEVAVEVSRLMAVDAYGLRRELGIVVTSGGEP